jgi:hypothetical protein
MSRDVSLIRRSNCNVPTAQVSNLFRIFVISLPSGIHQDSLPLQVVDVKSRDSQNNYQHI